LVVNLSGAGSSSNWGRNVGTPVVPTEAAMLVVAFVMLAGVTVGSVALSAGLRAGIGVLAGALVAAVLDAAGILWGTRRPLEPPAPLPVSVAHGPRAGHPDSGIPRRVLWLMLCDTFEVSVVVIALVGGLTYAVLVTFAWSLHFLAE
jgi:hypothetical protein